MNEKVLFITQAAVIAALYVVLTYLAALLGLSSGVIQVRFSEALTILPYFISSAVPGVAVGCLLANFLTGCAVLDIVFGTIATLIGGIGSYLLRKNKWLVPLPPIIANTLIVPWVLQTAYGVEDAYWYLMLTVGAGEVISCYVLGMILLFALDKHKKTIFR
ncbi:MAG: QueT transporter family protein [Lachnospiraceae bacterium]